MALSKALFRTVDVGIVTYLYALIDICSCRPARDESAMHDSERGVWWASDKKWHAQLESLNANDRCVEWHHLWWPEPTDVAELLRITPESKKPCYCNTIESVLIIKSFVTFFVNFAVDYKGWAGLCWKVFNNPSPLVCVLQLSQQ